MFGDLDWPLITSRGFVSISWACFSCRTRREPPCGRLCQLSMWTFAGYHALQSWAAQPAGVCGGGGAMPPHFWDQGVQGVQGAVQWKWSLLLYSRQSLFSTSLFEHDLYSFVCTSSLQLPMSCTSFKSISTNVGYANTKTMVGIQIADGKILKQDIS